jgi:hypothetical protein
VAADRRPERAVVVGGRWDSRPAKLAAAVEEDEDEVVAVACTTNASRCWAYLPPPLPPRPPRVVPRLVPLQPLNSTRRAAIRTSNASHSSILSILTINSSRLLAIMSPSRRRTRPSRWPIQ